MELTIIEKDWYNKLRQAGVDEGDSNLMARFKCLIDEFKKSSPVAINDFMELVNQDGTFYQFCIESGRLTSDEINKVFHHMHRSLQSIDNPFDNPLSMRFNPVETLWGYFKTIFK